MSSEVRRLWKSLKFKKNGNRKSKYFDANDEINWRPKENQPLEE